MLDTISGNNWLLVDLSVKESALEEIYVKLMGENGVQPVEEPLGR